MATGSMYTQRPEKVSKTFTASRAEAARAKLWLDRDMGLPSEEPRPPLLLLPSQEALTDCECRAAAARHRAALYFQPAIAWIAFFISTASSSSCNTIPWQAREKFIQKLLGPCAASLLVANRGLMYASNRGMQAAEHPFGCGLDIVCMVCDETMPSLTLESLFFTRQFPGQTFGHGSAVECPN
jgi:hypothetical protein